MVSIRFALLLLYEAYACVMYSMHDDFDLDLYFVYHRTSSACGLSQRCPVNHGRSHQPSSETA